MWYNVGIVNRRMFGWGSKHTCVITIWFSLILIQKTV